MASRKKGPKKSAASRARSKPGRVQLRIASIEREAVRRLRNAAAATGESQGEILARAIAREVARMERAAGVEAFPEARGPLKRGARPKGTT